MIIQGSRNSAFKASGGLPGGEWAIYDANVGVTKDGSDGVLQWNDQSGNGHHLTVTPTAKPLWEASQVNSLPAVKFAQASSNYIHTGSVGLNDPMTCFMVMKVNTYATNQRVWLDIDNTPYIRQDGSVDGSYRLYNGGGFNAGGMITVAAGWGIQMWMMNGSNSQQRFNLNTPVTGTLTAGINWAGCCFGSFVGASTSAGFQLAEAVVYESAVTDGVTQALIVNYLASKYGITV